MDFGKFSWSSVQGVSAPLWMCIVLLFVRAPLCLLACLLVRFVCDLLQSGAVERCVAPIDVDVVVVPFSLHDLEGSGVGSHDLVFGGVSVRCDQVSSHQYPLSRLESLRFSKVASRQLGVIGALALFPH